MEVILLGVHYCKWLAFHLQSFLARKSLNSQLQRVGVFSSNDCISMFSEDFEIFKNCKHIL